MQLLGGCIQLQASLPPFTDAKGVLGLHGAAGLKLLSKCAAAPQVGKSYSGPRDALRLTGKFVLSHLLEAAKGGHELASSPFVLGLHQEVAALPQGLTSIFQSICGISPGGI